MRYIKLSVSVNSSAVHILKWLFLMCNNILVANTFHGFIIPNNDY